MWVLVVAVILSAKGHTQTTKIYERYFAYEETCQRRSQVIENEVNDRANHASFVKARVFSRCDLEKGLKPS